MTDAQKRAHERMMATLSVRDHIQMTSDPQRGGARHLSMNHLGKNGEAQKREREETRGGKRENRAGRPMTIRWWMAR